MAKRDNRTARDRINHLQVVVDGDERRRIKDRAQEAGLSVSAYLRAVGLGKTIKPVLDHAAVGDLVRVAGDQGRLGGLLKLWLVDRPGRGPRRSRCAACWSVSASCKPACPRWSLGFDRQAHRRHPGRGRLPAPVRLRADRQPRASGGDRAPAPHVGRTASAREAHGRAVPMDQCTRGDFRAARFTSRRRYQQRWYHRCIGPCGHPQLPHDCRATVGRTPSDCRLRREPCVPHASE